MARKELIIKVVVENNQTATAIVKKGFNPKRKLSNSYEIVGILQNLIKIEQDRINEISTTIIKDIETKD